MQAAAVLAMALLAGQDPGPGSFLRKHCVDCHGPRKQKGRLRLDGLEDYRSGEAALWTRVYEQVEAGTMPPEERPRPAEAERRALLAWIEGRQRQGRGAVLRRLNRRELSAALRDLTGLRVDYAAALPGDGAVEGFDTGAEALQDTADSVDRMLEIARRAVEGLRFLDPPRRRVLAADLGGLRDPRRAFESWKSEGVTAKLGGTVPSEEGLLLYPHWVGERAETGFAVQPPARLRGILRLRLHVSALKRLAGLPNPYLWVEIGGKAFDYREITEAATETNRRIYEVVSGRAVPVSREALRIPDIYF